VQNCHSFWALYNALLCLMYPTKLSFKMSCMMSAKFHAHSHRVLRLPHISLLLTVTDCTGGRSGTHSHCCSSRGNGPVPSSPGNLPGATCLGGYFNSPHTTAATTYATPSCPHHFSLCPIFCFSPMHPLCDRCVPTGEAPPTPPTTPRVWCSASGAHATYHVPANVDSPSSCRCLCTLPMYQQSVQTVCVSSAHKQFV